MVSLIDLIIPVYTSLAIIIPIIFLIERRLRPRLRKGAPSATLPTATMGEGGEVEGVVATAALAAYLTATPTIPTGRVGPPRPLWSLIGGMVLMGRREELRRWRHLHE